MTINAPYINIENKRLVESVLDMSFEEFKGWPEDIQSIAFDLASEFFLIRSNPFVQAEAVKENIYTRLENAQTALSLKGYYDLLKEKLNLFWHDYQESQIFQKEIVEKIASCLSEEKIKDSPHAIVQFATDATGLIMELPIAVVFPENTKDVQLIVQLANELGFFIIPRGGGTGLTGGAVPAARRAIIMSMSRMKEIFQIDIEKRLLCAQAGVITSDAIQSAEEHDLLLTVDPASKIACSLGGNISENAGGPFAFEYGTTLDNILDYKMVTPQGEVIKVCRKDHPRHKIFPEDKATFEIFDNKGSLLRSIELDGQDIRAPGLGKDVTNKYLGGLPGVQKEGVDGIITEACFVLHPILKYSQTLCLEFYGASMRNASLVIGDLVRLRDRIRKSSNLVTMSALEEFGSKYVRAIDYDKKSSIYEGEPISVLLVRLDSNHKRALEDVVWTIVDITEHYQNVDMFIARDNEDAEIYWEDRHKLSAISRRTSGFKINEDIVIPLDKIPEISDYIESLNLYYLTLAYKNALQKVKELEDFEEGDEFVEMEIEVCSKILQREMQSTVAGEQEFSLQIHYFFQDLFSRYPNLKHVLQDIESDLFNHRLEIANHMHAGDGNCHVNIPVHANVIEMVKLAEEAVAKIFKKVLELGGEVSGEHGIGITKIRYLSDHKIKALKEYKNQVDSKNIINPDKLQQKDLLVTPYTLSWGRLIQDISNSNFPHKEKLIEQLQHILICTRCGKCKHVCPMYYPEKGYLYHPRNKNISLGYLLEALCYLQDITGAIDPELLSQLKDLMEYCTACGKCMSICPVKIDSAEIALNVRSYLEQEGVGHPLKSKMLNFLGREPERIPLAAKAAAVGMTLHNTAIRFIPAFWRRRMQNPFFMGPISRFDVWNLGEMLQIEKGNVFVPERSKNLDVVPGVLYFPGCGSSLFYAGIGLAGLFLLLKVGVGVVIPDEHKCCGYPLLFSGCFRTFEQNKRNNLDYFNKVLLNSREKGIEIDSILTSCGTCRASLQEYNTDEVLPGSISLMDVFQFLIPKLEQADIQVTEQKNLLYHSSCHSAWTGVSQNGADSIYSQALSELFDCEVNISQYCCAESGLGALTAPGVYNNLRKRKKDELKKDLQNYPEEQPILVSCPSCKVGISRIVNNLKANYSVYHSLEFLAEKIGGKDWKEKFINDIQNKTHLYNGIRYINI